MFSNISFKHNFFFFEYSTFKKKYVHDCFFTNKKKLFIYIVFLLFIYLSIILFNFILFNYDSMNLIVKVLILC